VRKASVIVSDVSSQMLRRTCTWVYVNSKSRIQNARNVRRYFAAARIWHRTNRTLSTYPNEGAELGMLKVLGDDLLFELGRVLYDEGFSIFRPARDVMGS
jgi:hypothetical protein